jgi:hypothetical protein
LSSMQFGQADVAAGSDAAFMTRGDLTGSTTSVARDSNVALGVVNDADNAIGLSGVSSGSLGGEVTATAEPFGPPAATGTAALANQQFSTGSAQASAISRIGHQAGTGLSESRISVEDNSTAAEATGNRVTNSVASDGAGVALASGQTNIAVIGASALMDFGFGIAAPGIVEASTIDVRGNSASALARGNAADNAMTVGTGDGGNDVLLNSQANYGRVAASASGISSVPLNFASPAGVQSSAIAAGSNTLAASAYGNVASNVVTMTGAGTPAAIGLTNAQVNYGGVTATVAGGGYRADLGALSTSTLSISGNQISAMAVGNQASSAIAAPR